MSDKVETLLEEGEIGLFWRKDRDSYRVWSERFYGDRFEVIDEEEFKLLSLKCEVAGITLQEAED